MFFNLNANFFENIGKIFTTPTYLTWLLRGLGTTLLLSLGATLVGLILGTLVAVVKILPSKNPVIKVLRVIANVYTAIFRGTPMALQLFIMVFAVLAIFAVPQFPLELVAIAAFGINSGAYVSESIRAGIQSVDIGQMEAGRSLGLSYGKTMWKIVIPQAIKNVIPAVGNEIIALIKETSIVSMVGEIKDLTFMAQLMAGGDRLADYLAPMTVVAIFYLGIVCLLTLAIKLIERRLRQSDKR
ncbi:MAG: amino acid ABC transporter permease [Clostridia bacterium]|nr:amino acid ABC transporter permease [Clostridia bacterium]